MKIKGNYISRHHLKRISIIAMHDNIVISSYPHIIRTRTFAFRLLSLYAASLVFPQTASSVALLEYLAIVLLLAKAWPCVFPLEMAKQVIWVGTRSKASNPFLDTFFKLIMSLPVSILHSWSIVSLNSLPFSFWH